MYVHTLLINQKVIAFQNLCSITISMLSKSRLIVDIGCACVATAFHDAQSTLLENNMFRHLLHIRGEVY